MDIGYYLNEATTQFGYLTGMATSLIGLPIILTTSLAASLVPAVSEAHAQGNVNRIVQRAGTAIKMPICSQFQPVLAFAYWRHLFHCSSMQRLMQGLLSPLLA